MISFRVQGIDELIERAKSLFGNKRPMLAAMGRGVGNLLRRHFAKLETGRPNKQGWPRTHFWREVLGSVQNPVVTADTASVAINHVAMAQRYFGGEIRPFRRQWLTIAASPESYGKVAPDFSDLEFGMAVNPFGRLQRALGRGRDTHTEADGSRTSILRDPLFWLTKRVNQKPDPTTLPTDAELSAAAADAGENYLAAKLAQMGGAA